MKTNFFENIANLNAPGTWTISIHNDENGHFVVSALYTPHKTNEPATKTIVPLIHKGTADDMDNGFFEATLQQVEATKGLYSNIKAVTASIETAKKKLGNGNKSQPTKTTTGGTADAEMPDPKIALEEKRIAAEEKKKAYLEAIKKVVSLNDFCKYEEALAILPSVEDYPDKAEELNKRKADLIRKKEQMAQAMELFKS